MTTKTTVLLIAISSLSLGLLAQKTVINGYVLDATNGEALIGANIQILSTKAGAVSNEYGYFSLVVKANDAIQLVCSYVGYTADTLSVAAAKEAVFLNVKLEPYTLETVEVVATPVQSEVGQIAVPVERLKLIPVLLGEPDLFKALSLLAGISTGVEGTSGLHIRGGSPDQNLVLLDGSTVYNTGHLFGFLSVFNPGAGHSIRVYKSGIPARFGSRIGGVVDITMKEGNSEKRQTEKTFGLISSSITHERPLTPGKSSFLISGRLAYSPLITALTWSQYRNGGALVAGGMYDLNAKVNFKLRKQDRLFISGYAGDDLLYTQEQIDNEDKRALVGWGNKTASIRYNRLLSNGFFSHSMANFNLFHYNNHFSVRDESTQEETHLKNKSSVEEIALKQHFSISPLQNHFVYFGVEGFRYRFSPNVATSDSDSENLDSLLSTSQNKIVRHSAALFLEEKWQVFSNLTADAGIRLQYYDIEEGIFQLEPRLKLSYSISNPLRLTLGYEQLSQNVHLLSTGGFGLPAGLWVPATENAPPQQSRQWFAGVHYTFPNVGLRVSTEAYYRKLEQLIDYRDGTNLFSYKNLIWEEVIEKEGVGEIYGLELLLEGNSDVLSWWLAYTYSKSTRTFSKINNGRTYAADFDRPHDLGLTVAHQLGDKWSVSSNFVFQSGAPVTLRNAVQVRFFGDLISNAYTAKNNARLPAYHRLDVALNKNYTNRKGRDVRLSFGCYNIYNRRNVVSVTSEFRGERGKSGNAENQIPVYRSRALFGIVPTFSYTVNY